jgi:hypothetical protein
VDAFVEPEENALECSGRIILECGAPSRSRRLMECVPLERTTQRKNLTRSSPEYT